MIQELKQILLLSHIKGTADKANKCYGNSAMICWGCDATQFSSDVPMFEKNPLPPHLA